MKKRLRELMNKDALPPMVVTLLGCDVIITPVLERKLFGLATPNVSFKFEYNNDELKLNGVTEEELQAEIRNFIDE
jgi:hypothetical protein